MPLKKCSENKQSGWKWGDQGKCYTGPEGKKQAIRQGVAIEVQKNSHKKSRLVMLNLQKKIMNSWMML